MPFEAGGFGRRERPVTFDIHWWAAAAEVFQKICLIMGGAFGLWLAWKRVTVANLQAEAQVRQAALSRQDHVAELFNRAIS